MQQIEISDGQSGSSFPKYISNYKSNLRSSVSCSDHHHELNFFAAVHKNSGIYVILLFLNYFLSYISVSSKVKKYIM